VGWLEARTQAAQRARGDAFINRLLWLLRGGKKLLDYLELPSFLTSSAFEHYVPDFMPAAPLQAMLQIRDDPLHYLRLAETAMLIPLRPSSATRSRTKGAFSRESSKSMMQFVSSVSVTPAP
jgi:hypothetical protein